MRLCASKFDYSARFHVLFAGLKGGSSLRSAEQNAFGKPAAELEKEAADHLAAHDWQPVTFGGRPLDPRRDFGEHSVSAAAQGVYIADAQLATDKKTAEAAYKTAIEAGGPAAALGYEGLAQVAQFEGTDPGTHLDN